MFDKLLSLVLETTLLAVIWVFIEEVWWGEDRSNMSMLEKGMAFVIAYLIYSILIRLSYRSNKK